MIHSEVQGHFAWKRATGAMLRLRNAERLQQAISNTDASISQSVGWWRVACIVIKMTNRRRCASTAIADRMIDGAKGSSGDRDESMLYCRLFQTRTARKGYLRKTLLMGVSTLWRSMPHMSWMKKK